MQNRIYSVGMEGKAKNWEIPKEKIIDKICSDSLKNLKKERINRTKTPTFLIKKIIPFEKWHQEKISKELIKNFIITFNENTLGITKPIKGNYFILEKKANKVYII